MMDMIYVHIAIGFIACLITASWGYRAGRDHGKEIQDKDDKQVYLEKFKMMDQRIQDLKLELKKGV